jgi:DNA-binding XRE family transcriptional regulator
MDDKLTPAQLRGARAMLDWSIVDLAKIAQVSISTIKRLEHRRFLSNADRSTPAVRSAFETAGVHFLADDGDGPGLRCRAAVAPREHQLGASRRSG